MRTDAVEPAAPEPLRSKHTSNFPALLERLGISLAVTTYQAGKLVLLRTEGDQVNTHFRNFLRPMGLAADATCLAVGTALEIRTFRNMVPVCRRLKPPGRHDACFLPRDSHVTGNIDIHEMSWVGEELWFVNTRFSCLCTLDGIHSFVPRWRPLVRDQPGTGGPLSPEWLVPHGERPRQDGFRRQRSGGLYRGPPWPPPIRPRAGGRRSGTVAFCSKCPAAKFSSTASPCRTPRAGMAGGYGCSNREREASASSTRPPAATRASRRCPDSPAG